MGISLHRGTRPPEPSYRRPVDLRKGFEGLSALVPQALGKDPLSRSLFLFTNRRRTTAIHVPVPMKCA